MLFRTHNPHLVNIIKFDALTKCFDEMFHLVYQCSQKMHACEWTRKPTVPTDPKCIYMRRPVVKADFISATKLKRNGHQPIWSTAYTVSTPAPRWQDILDFPVKFTSVAKLHPLSASRALGLVAEFAGTMMVLERPFMISCDESESRKMATVD